MTWKMTSIKKSKKSLGSEPQRFLKNIHLLGNWLCCSLSAQFYKSARLGHSSSFRLPNFATIFCTIHLHQCVFFRLSVSHYFDESSRNGVLHWLNFIGENSNTLPSLYFENTALFLHCTSLAYVSLLEFALARNSMLNASRWSFLIIKTSKCMWSHHHVTLLLLPCSSPGNVARCKTRELLLKYEQEPSVVDVFAGSRQKLRN